MLSLPIFGNFRPIDVYEYLSSNLNLDVENVTVLKGAKSVLQAYEKTLNSKDISTIVFPENSINYITVNITGAVRSPGFYEITENTSLSELYKLAGGLTAGADESAIFFSRESIKEQERNIVNEYKKIALNYFLTIQNNTQNNSDIDGLIALIESASNINFAGRLTGNLMPSSIESNGLILEQNDFIFIPSYTNTVSVSGEVLQPITTLYNTNTTVEELIDKAGGFAKTANKKQIYIIKKNGTSIPYRSSYFTNAKFLEPGDTIVVPRDFDSINLLPGIASATQIISNIAFAAASLESLSN